MVFVETTPASLPWAKQPHLLLKLCVHMCWSLPCNNVSIVSFFCQVGVCGLREVGTFVPQLVVVPPYVKSWL